MLFSSYWKLFPWRLSGQVVELTADLHLMSRLKVSGTVPPLPQCPFMGCTGTLAFNICLRKKCSGWIADYLDCTESIRLYVCMHGQHSQNVLVTHLSLFCCLRACWPILWMSCSAWQCAVLFVLYKLCSTISVDDDMVLCTTKKHPINGVFHHLHLLALALYHSSHQSSPPLELWQYNLNTTMKEWQYTESTVWDLA
jgi:hypothetical protein